MAVPVFHGRVFGDGELVLDEQERFDAYLSTLKDGRVEVTVRRPRTQRSIEQNAYFHAVPVKLMAEYMGEDHMATLYALLGECFGYHFNQKVGRIVPNKGSSSALTTEEFSHLIEWCPPWALLNHGVHIPLPNEVDFAL